MADTSLLDETVWHRLTRPDVSRLVVALSGGIDSVVLLHEVCQGRIEVPVVAIHINHNLQQAAEGFEKSCRDNCDLQKVDLTVRSVSVDKRGSLEAGAREARYQAFEDFLEEGDLLLLAHHADDQAETILFRLLRDGRMEGMPEERPVGKAVLYRPLLGVGRDRIEAAARENGLQWSEDPTNAELDADRNYLRHEILPRLESRWPSVRQTLVRGALTTAQLEKSHQSLLAVVSTEAGLPVDCLELEPLQKCHQVDLVARLKSWVLSLKAPVPTGRMLDEIARQIIGGHQVDVVSTWLAFRTHDGKLYLRKPLPELKGQKFQLKQGQVDLGAGTLTNKKTEGRGLKADSAYEVRFRAGGESIRIRHQRDLKFMFQQMGVPVWLRNRVPLIFRDDQLVGIAGLPDWQIPMVIADGSQAVEEPGWLVEFEPGDRLRG